MNGSQAIVAVLEKEGVDIIFGYPGGTALPLYDALYDADIKHVLTRHEQGAAHAADGYARATGRVGVCISTSGPGATNLITGIATGYMDSSPIVFITCQVSRSMIGKDSFQEADIRGITTPITKHNYLIKKPEDLTRCLHQAFYIAATGRPGPVVVDVPKDILTMEIGEEIDEEIHLPGYKPLYAGKIDEVEKAAAMIKAAKKPLFFVGGGARNQEKAYLFRDIVAKTQIPVVSSLIGLGVFPGDDPLHLGMVGMHGTYAANQAMTQCDLLIGCGVRFDDRVTGLLSGFAPNAKIIHFEIDAAEINKNVRVHHKVLADLAWSLKELTQIVEKPNSGDWTKQVLDWKAEKPIRFSPSKEEEIKPQQVIEKIRELTKDNATIVTDTGQHQMWSAQLFQPKEPFSFITSGGLGTMGFGLPAAIGAQFGNPKEEVWVIVGDGGILMNCQELATAVEHRLPIKIIVMNNRCLGMVCQWQRLFYEKRYSGSVYELDSNLAKIAEAFGAKGIRVSKYKDLAPALEKAKGSKKPILVEVMVASEENVLPMVPTGAGLNEMIEWSGEE